MYLYNLTLQKPTSIYQSISGSFTAPKSQEIVISKGTLLELLQIDSNGKLKTLISREAFCQIRHIAPFRLTGNKQDHIILLSDSGRIVILEADLEKNDFVKVHQETFGKTGCRRIVPGEYIGVDPKGRAVMIAAIEKQKFVYILNRDNENKMTISSPLEAHKAHSICYDLVGLDVGYENPLFACIEVDYGDEDDENSGVCTGKFQKLIVYYEMELSLNHVVKKKYEKIDFTAHLLAPVYKTAECPGGVLIFCENYVMYKGLDGVSKMSYFQQRFENIYSEHKKGVMIVNYSIYKRKEIFFVIAQSELGDLYKISLEFNKGKINDIIIQYFDTIPVANSINILISGYLFAASETSNHSLYNVLTFDIKENQKLTSHSTTNENIIGFNPTELTYLQQEEEINSLTPITDMIIDDLQNEGVPQLYTLTGKGSRASLKILKYGLSANVVGSSTLPGEPIGVWSIKEKITDEYDKYIVVSFINATLILGISDKISEITNSGFDKKNSTLHIDIMCDNSYIQVISTGIIYIAKEKKSFLKANSKITCACSNAKQVILGLENTELLYFEHDGSKLCQPFIKRLDTEIICADLCPIMEGRTRSKFVAVGCGDNTTVILSLEITQQYLYKISTQLLPQQIQSVKFLSHKDEEDNVYLYHGLSNGVLIKTTVDSTTGSQTDGQMKYLGSVGVKLFNVISCGEKALVANSSHPYLCYKYMGKYYSDAISMPSIECVTSFNAEQCNEGIITITGDELKIIKVDNLNDKFSQNSYPLRYTPRKLLLTPMKTLITIESDPHSYSNHDKEIFKEKISQISKDEKYLQLKEEIIGAPYASEGNWGSCIRVIDPASLSDLDLIELENNECALSGVICNFSSSEETYLIIGTAVNFKQLPHKSFTSANILVCTLKDNCTKIVPLFKQKCDDIVLAFCEYEGKLLAGIGNILTLFEIGKNHLLKKCETKKITDTITKIQVNGQRILVNSMNESFYFLRHRTNENQFYIFADDVIPRWLTSSIFLDYDTVAGTDKFENFFIYRLPQGCDEENKNDPMGSKKKWEVGYLHGAAYKLNLIAQFHLGDFITCIKKCNLQGGSDNVICYATSSGRIGVFMPFETREEVDFFIHLEMYSRIEIDNIAGRDHQMFRSSYGPVKCVIDGDLCEEFISIEKSKQKILAKELDKGVNVIINKLEDMRNKII